MRAQLVRPASVYETESFSLVGMEPMLVRLAPNPVVNFFAPRGGRIAACLVSCFSQRSFAGGRGSRNKITQMKGRTRPVPLHETCKPFFERRDRPVAEYATGFGDVSPCQWSVSGLQGSPFGDRLTADDTLKEFDQFGQLHRVRIAQIESLKGGAA